MAKTGVDPTVAAKAAELKRELQRLVRTIIDDDDLSAATVDRAKEALCCLSELRQRKRSSLSPKIHDAMSCPEVYRCPLSKELMTDPVVVSTGQTYDRALIERWFKSGNRTCPQTQQVLTHTTLTPNNLIRELISQWCKNQGIKFPDPLDYNNDALAEADRAHFHSLLEKLSSSLPDQKEAAKELRLLTRRTPSFRALFGDSPDAIPRLLKPLSGGGSGSGSGDSRSFSDFAHPDLQEDIITTMLNLSIHDGNKKIVAETPAAIPVLIDALRAGTISSRSNAAAAIFTLSAPDANKTLIGKSGALRPLIDLLEEGHPQAMKDVASAIFNLCIIHENRVRAVREGAVGVIVRKIADRLLVDELVAILAMLSGHQRAVEEMGEAGAVPCLLGIIRESACARNKENCIAILHTVCYSDRGQWKFLREEESARGTISDLAKNGSSRAKRKASGILDRLNRFVNITHTA